MSGQNIGGGDGVLRDLSLGVPHRLRFLCQRRRNDGAHNNFLVVVFVTFEDGVGDVFLDHRRVFLRQRQGVDTEQPLNDRRAGEFAEVIIGGQPFTFGTIRPLHASALFTFNDGVGALVQKRQNRDFRGRDILLANLREQFSVYAQFDVVDFHVGSSLLCESLAVNAGWPLGPSGIIRQLSRSARVLRDAVVARIGQDLGHRVSDPSGPGRGRAGGGAGRARGAGGRSGNATNERTVNASHL